MCLYHLYSFIPRLWTQFAPRSSIVRRIVIDLNGPSPLPTVCVTELGSATGHAGVALRVVRSVDLWPGGNVQRLGMAWTET